MKNIVSSILVIAALVLSLSSCVSQKEVVYFQNSDSIYIQGQSIKQLYDMRIKPADRISVSITCSDIKLLKDFATNLTMGTNEGNVTSSAQSREVYTGYTVDNEGNVTLPVVGKIKAKGFTEEEFAKEIEKKIIEKGIVFDPQVTVKFTNASVSVLGAVKNPGRFQLTTQRNSILDILAAAGDITNNGLKKNIKLFREVDGKLIEYKIDLRQSDVFTSPAYYVQQNDLIYVEPNRTAQVTNSPFFTFWTAGASIVSLGISITTLVLAITR